MRTFDRKLFLGDVSSSPIVESLENYEVSNYIDHGRPQDFFQE